MHTGRVERQLQMKQYLIGKTICHQRFQPAHAVERTFCVFCRAFFGSYSLDLKIGYYEQESDSWICEPCAEEYQEPFQWTVADSKELRRESAAFSEVHSGLALF